MEVKITQAVISAGGFGTRLRSFTNTAPKPMIPVLGKPILEWHIEQFKKHGVTNFLFTLHYLPEVITDYFGDGSSRDVKIDYVIEEKPLGSAGGIKLFQDKLRKRFYYIYGDIFSLMDYSAMAKNYATKESPFGMQRVKHTHNYSDADVAELDETCRFVGIHAKPHTEKYANAYRMRGAFILEKEICDYISEGASDLAKDVLPAVVAAGKNFYGYECDDYSKGIDTVEKLKEVGDYLRSKNISP